jgi:WD repeat-containing protein 35
VATYFGNWNEAEQIYNAMDARELSIELRENMGNWKKVIQLCSKPGFADESKLLRAQNMMGDYYAERQMWAPAKAFYLKTNNIQMLMKAAYHLDDFDGLSALVRTLPRGTAYLKEIGLQFQSVGLCEEAVSAFLLGEEPQAAVDCCVLLNEWKRAIDLATEHKFPQTEGLLTKYASHLLRKKEYFQAIELYHKANRCTDAAKLLSQLASKQGGNPLRAKKLYVLAALEMERYRAANLDTRGRSAAQTVDSLLQHESAMDSGEEMANPWPGAEAYHFLMLAQRLLSNGNLQDAMNAAVRLTEYEDVVDLKTVYSLIAIASFHSRFYGQASRAFIRLESMGSAEERESYRQLAVKIFTRHPPRDPQDPNAIQCPSPSCGQLVPSWASSCPSCARHFTACVATGRPIHSNSRDTFMCQSCQHSMYASEIGPIANCPLCHALLR